MRDLCVTVTEVSPEAEANLERLLGSLERQRADIDLVLVVRGGRERPAYARGRVRVHPVVAPRRIALSVARNRALAHARRAALLDDARVVAFPDDDCRYPDGLLSSVAGYLASTGCECLSGAYGPGIDEVDRHRFPPCDAPLTPSLIMRSGCSGSMFFTARAVRAIGSFDERLGLGAEFGASEDADYLLRALALGFAAAYRPLGVVVEHPYKPDRPAQYYVGNVAVLAKHARGRVGTRLLLGRRLLGGLLLAARSRLPLGELRRAVAATFALTLARDRPASSPSHAIPEGFVATTSAAVDLDRPLRDIVVAPPRSGGRYGRCLVLVRLHEEPLGVVQVDVVEDRVRAPDLAQAVFASLSSALRDHVRRHDCSTSLAARCGGAGRSPDRSLPPVALIIPTAARADDIGRCLAGLGVLDYPELEIVVVDNRPDQEATRRVVEAAAGVDTRIRYVAEHRPGSSVARNRGLAETSADIVAFTDDDVAVDALWVRWMVEPFMRDERVQVVTGAVLPASYDTPAQQAFEEYAGFGKGFDRRVYDMDANRPGDQLLFPYWGAPFGSGNSMAFRRPALVAAGGFDPALGAGSPALAGADIESFTRVVVGGGRLVYEPRAVVWHDHRREDGALVRQLFNYGAGSTAILTKWLLRDPRVSVAVLRAVKTVAVGALRSKSRRSGETPRELARLSRQLAVSSERSQLTRQLRGFASGPLLYLRSRRWARRQNLAAVLTDRRPDAPLV